MVGVLFGSIGRQKPDLVVSDGLMATDAVNR